MQKRNNFKRLNFGIRFWALSLFFSFSLFANDLLIQKNYQEIATYSINKLQKLTTHSHSINGFDPLLEKQFVYSGVSLQEVLQKHFANEWKSGKNLIFAATDGYRKIVSVKKIKKYLQSNLIYITYPSSKNKLPVIEKSGKQITFDPYYIVWGGTTQENAKKQLHLYSWVYQLKSINLQM